jgi:DNA polymerase-3 subunit alpha
MKEIERVGLLKMDFLGLSTLTLLDDAVKHIKETLNVDIDLEKLPLDDPKTFQLFCAGQTQGVFQFESSGMRDTLRKAKPAQLEDLIALNALYRPGPLRGGVVDDYINRRHGRVEVKYELPQMEAALKESYGVIAYQEQVMRLASELAGFTLGEADLLRKAMGKKNAAVMQAQRERFITGAKARGTPEKKASKVFELMEFFAGYGFNKSHSTAYALLAYQTGYLKANFPQHFMAALLTIESQNSEKIAMYLAECRDLGVPMLPPDINKSELPFTVQPGGVRFGLGAVKNVGEGAILSMIAARKKLGTITSLFEIVENVDMRLVNKKVFESLAKAGAFDTLAPPTSKGPLYWRARIVANLDRLVDHGGRFQRDRDQGQTGLFGGDFEPATADPHAGLAEAKPWSESEALTFEKEALGLFMSGHPVVRYAGAIQAVGAKRLGEMTQSEADVSTAGIVTGTRQLKTKRGDRMAVFMLEDEAGKVEVVVFPEAYNRYGGLIADDALLMVRGKYERDEDNARMVAAELTPLDVIRDRAIREVLVTVPAKTSSKEFAKSLQAVFERHPGNCRVSIILDTGQGRVKTQTQRKVRPSDAFIGEVDALCGAGSVELLQSVAVAAAAK